ncbi:tyrosine--tRNA ligase [Patescibacteria group bacterium]|nr:tyrosine--tRNA ligase [Patescibacteria group bacterium]
MTIDQVLDRAVDQVLPSKKGLKDLMQTKKIKLYLGIDPTAKGLHLGHTVPLRKLQQFADLGHEVILLFGTGTVLVGDPSERDTGRKLITQKEVEANIKTWKKQVSSVLNFKKIKLKQNGDWLLKLNLKDIIKIGSNISAIQLFKRDNFTKRLKAGDTVWYHETLYPLLQGYDSVVMNVDLEIGGTDQTFNMLVGRELQKKMNNREKFVLTGKMIMGTDGKKMSKTSNNCIWLTDSANDMYGKLMGVRDKLLPDYYEFFTDINLDSLDLSDPLTAKKKLALIITTQFHGDKKAKEAQTHFETTFQKKAPEFKQTIKNQLTLLATIAQILPSNSQAKRLILDGAVHINNQTIKDFNHKTNIGDKIKIGKKTFVKVI